MPRFLNARDDLVGGLLVDAGEDRGQRLEQRDLAADVGEVRRELAADRAAADDRGARRDLVELEQVVGREDVRRRRTAMPGSSRGDEPVARISASPMSSEPSETRTWWRGGVDDRSRCRGRR